MGKMKHQIYVGSDPELKGKTALVMDDPESTTRGVLAQFDDMSLKQAFNWWFFYSYDFKNLEDIK